MTTSILYARLRIMPINQKGISVVIIILGLVIFCSITLGGYYLIQNQQNISKIQPIQNPSAGPSATHPSSIEEVKQASEATLLKMEGVEKVEVGENNGEPCVVVFTFEETEELQNLEDTGLGGYKVKIQNTSQADAD